MTKSGYIVNYATGGAHGMTQKANSTKLFKCGCGRVTLVLLDDDDKPFSSCEYDPDQWLRVCTEIIDKNEELVINGFVPHDHLPS